MSHTLSQAEKLMNRLNARFIGCVGLLVASGALAAPMTDSTAASTSKSKGKASAESRAAERGQHFDELLPSADTNKDGKLSLEEWLARRGKFQRLDANNDGVVTAKESPKHEEDVANLIKRSDANKDGKVTADEWNATRVASFKRRDANGDNILERAEYVAYESRGD